MLRIRCKIDNIQSRQKITATTVAGGKPLEMKVNLGDFFGLSHVLNLWKSIVHIVALYSAYCSRVYRFDCCDKANDLTS